MSRAGRGKAWQIKRARKQAQRTARESRKAKGIIKGSHPTRPNRTSPYETVEQERQGRTDAVVEHARLIRQLLRTLLGRLLKIPDPRKPLMVRHTLKSLMVYGILMFALQTGSRRCCLPATSSLPRQATFPLLASLQDGDEGVREYSSGTG